MAGGFRSIGVALGLDTTGLQRGFNQGLNQLDKFLGDFRKKLQAGGFRGVARLLGPGAAIFGVYEAYRLATQAADDFLKKQEDIRKEIQESAISKIGTPEEGKSRDALLAFNYTLSDTQKAIVSAQQSAKGFWNDIVESASVGVAKFQEFNLWTDRVATKVSGLFAGASQQDIDDALKTQTTDFGTDQDKINAGIEAKDAYEKAVDDKKNDLDKEIDAEKVKADAAYDKIGEREKTPEEQLDDNVRRANELKAKTSSTANYADTVEGRMQMKADVAEMTELYGKQDELLKSIREEEEKRLAALTKSRELADELAVAQGKQQGIEEEQAIVQKELAANQAEQWANLFLNQDQRNQLKERELELTQKDNELTQRKIELESELKNIEGELLDLQYRKTQSELESLAPSQADLLKKGGGGSAAQRAAAQEAERHKKDAERNYNEYADYNAIANDPRQSREARARARAQATAAAQRADAAYKAEQGADDKSGSKEGLQHQQQSAEEARRAAELQKRASDINNQLSGKQAPPLTGPEFTKAIGDLKASIDKMSAKLDPKAAVTN